MGREEEIERGEIGRLEIRDWGIGIRRLEIRDWGLGKRDWEIGD